MKPYKSQYATMKTRIILQRLYSMNKLKHLLSIFLIALASTGCNNNNQDYNKKTIANQQKKTAELRYKVAIFDLEGTLIDSSDAYAEILNAALKEFKAPLVTPEKIRLSTGNGLRGVCQKCFPDNRTNEFEDFYKSVKKHEDEYSKAHNNNVAKAYTGSVEMIKNLQSKGVDVYILTNRDHDQTMQVLNKIFPNVFDDNHIISPNDPKLKKPNPKLTLELIEKLKTDKKYVVFVGDTDVDIKTARGAGIDVISVDWGAQTREQLKNSGGNNFADSFKHIEKMIVDMSERSCPTSQDSQHIKTDIVKKAA